MVKEKCALLLLSLSIGMAMALDICEQQMNGAQLLHPADCSKFIVCENGKTDRIGSCPLGLHFNRFKGACDLRQRSACDITFVNFPGEETNCSACCALYGCYVNPECPNIPGTPTTPPATDTPATPQTPDTPVTPVTPDTSDTPGTPATPQTPATPVTPDTSDTPGTPATPQNPATPVTPDTSDTPATPQTPATPVTPDTSDTPGTPATPQTPATPITPDTSDTPGTPATPQTPATPVTPDTSDTTGTPTTPQTPATPVTPDTSDTPGTPATPQTPATPVTPDTSDTPGTPANPQTPATPVTPDTPQFPETPATPDIPATPATPETPVTPDITVTPGLPGSPVTPETPATPETPITPGTPPTSETPSPITSKCSNNLTVCIGESDGFVLHVNGTCNKYIVCVGGCANIMPCPDNLQYNIATGRCDYPQNVNCPWQSTPPITGPSGIACAHHGQCADQPDGKLFASRQDNGYIVCQCECEMERPCPNGTKFNEELLTCASDSLNETVNNRGTENGNENTNENGNENVSSNGSGSGYSSEKKLVCPNGVQICKNQTDGELFPVDGVCNKFFKCSYGCAIEILCPNNLIYNPSKEYCDNPQNYKCPWTHNPSSDLAAGPSGIACASGGRCTGQTEGTLLPSLTSCSKYVVCQCECEVEMNCSDNLYWDSKLLTCNYSSNVTCELDEKYNL